MAYATFNKPSLHFNTKLYTGNGTAIGSGGNAITGVGHQPDFVWIKDRSAGNNHNLYDVLRGGQKGLQTSNNGAEYTNTEVLNSFNSDGFTVGDSGGVNTNSNNYVSWNWKAGGAGSANTDGNVNSTVSVNTTAGFSIVSWASNGQEQSIGHGLGVTPKMIIMKTRGTGDGWIVGHEDAGWANYMVLNGSTAKISDDRMFSPSGGSDPTNSLWWTNSTAWVTGGSTDCIAYCFTEKKGYSKFGKYMGNGNDDGPFIYTGFKPAWVIIKSHIGTDNWIIYDNKRNGSNGQGSDAGNARLYANTNSVEDLTADQISFHSNGFAPTKDYSSINYNDGNYIYMAFAEEPLVANVGESIPATAR